MIVENLKNSGEQLPLPFSLPRQPMEAAMEVPSFYLKLLCALGVLRCRIMPSEYEPLLANSRTGGKFAALCPFYSG